MYFGTLTFATVNYSYFIIFHRQYNFSTFLAGDLFIPKDWLVSIRIEFILQYISISQTAATA